MENTDELVIDLEKLYDKYAKRYDKTGHKSDRFRRRMVDRFIGQFEDKIEEIKLQRMKRLRALS